MTATCIWKIKLTLIKQTGLDQRQSGIWVWESKDKNLSTPAESSNYKSTLT
jgi:hypothetical protein